MATTDLPLPQLRRFGETSRRDAWWVMPVLVVAALTAFLVYTTWAAFQGRNYFYHGDGAHYLSPFYSPLLFGQANEPRWFASTQPGWWPTWMPFSAALLILFAPAGFRFTCYYYRGAYYKAFWGDPSNCAVGEPSLRGKRYRGENALPLILQNAHRYFFYLAAIFILFLLHDAWMAMWFTQPDGTEKWGIGVGTLVILMNAILLGGYTFGCHCSRHLFGGRKDTLSSSPAQSACYSCVSSLNRGHMRWAWASLVWVAFTDVYVRLLCAGVIHDVRLV